MVFIVLVVLAGLAAALPFLRQVPVLGGIAAGGLRLLRVLNEAGFRLAGAAAFLIALVQFAAVILRNVFAVNFIWLQESATYLFGVAILLASGAVLLRDGHVRVDILYSRWALGRRRLIDLLGLYLFVIPVGLLVIVASAPYVTASWAIRETSIEATGIPAVYLLKSLVPAFGFLLVAAAAVRADELLRQETPPPEETAAP